MRPMLPAENASAKAAWTANLDAEARAAGVVSDPKRSVKVEKVMVTWAAWRGKDRRGPRDSAAAAPVIREVRRRERGSSHGNGKVM